MKKYDVLLLTLPFLFFGQAAQNGLAQTGNAAAAEVPDCNAVTVVGSPCMWPNGNPPGLQKYLGQIDLPKSDHSGTTLVNMTEPFPPVVHPAAMIAKKPIRFAIGGMYSLQSETLDFSPPKPNGTSFVPNNHVSDGFTLFAKRQWSDWRGIEVRGEFIQFDAFVDSLSLNPGANHTYSITVGPNIQHRFGRLTPYFTPEIGYLSQYISGLKVSGAAGLDLVASKHLTVRLGDFEYGYAAAQFVSTRTNPLHGRDKLSTGIYYSF